MNPGPARVFAPAVEETLGERVPRLDDIVSVHVEAFPRFFLTQLGPRFLRDYYRCVLEYPGGILLTEGGPRGVQGFVAGFLNPPAFYRELRRRRVRLALAAVAGLIARPSRLGTLRANYHRAGDLAHETDGTDTAELSSLAVRTGSTGTGIGSRLVRRFAEVARAQGAERVVLTTDAEGNEAVNRFYRRLGFACTRTFEARPGRVLNEYTAPTSQFR
jgi:ribosomal protein S18 acetylase RimI-like enzyme